MLLQEKSKQDSKYSSLEEEINKINNKIKEIKSINDKLYEEKDEITKKIVQEQERLEEIKKRRKLKGNIYVATRNYNSSIIAIATRYLGVPYVWGGDTPKGFDCSGFTQYVFRQLGIYLPRTASEQQRVGISISKSEIRQGDLVFFGKIAHHVGIYAGNGYMIHAPQTGDVVRYSKINWNKVSTIKRMID